TEDIKVPVRYPLTGDKIRFAGDAVAVVVAERREQAIDAAELVSITATELPAVTDIEKAAADGASLIHDELGTNVTVHWVHVGGGFGSKLNVYAEEALALALAKRLGRPVKWIEERSENYVATTHGRGVLHDVTLAADEQGKLIGMKFVELADMGAYYQLLTPGIPELGGWVYMGPYDPQTYWY